MDIIKKLRKLRYNILEKRRQTAEKYLNYDDCWKQWKKFLESVETEQVNEVTI